MSVAFWVNFAKVTVEIRGCWFKDLVVSGFINQSFFNRHVEVKCGRNPENRLFLQKAVSKL